MSIAETSAVVYAAGVGVAAVGAWVAAHKRGDRDRPPARSLVWSVVAGMLWPVILVGMVQMLGVGVLMKAVGRARSAHGAGGEVDPGPVERIRYVMVMPPPSVNARPLAAPRSTRLT
jgi:hypothetical protein